MVIIITALYWNFHNWCPTLADKITWPYTWFLTSMNSPQYDFISKKIGYLFWVNGNVDKLTFERWGKPPCCSLTWRRSPLVPGTINSNHDVLKAIHRWITFRLHYKEAHSSPFCDLSLQFLSNTKLKLITISTEEYEANSCHTWPGMCSPSSLAS